MCVCLCVRDLESILAADDITYLGGFLLLLSLNFWNKIWILPHDGMADAQRLEGGQFLDHRFILNIKLSISKIDPTATLRSTP